MTAVAAAGRVKLGEDRQLLVCEAGDREMADLRAKPELLANLARTSGGQSWPVAEKDSTLASSLFGQPPPATVEYRRTPLWDKSWWLGTILTLLTVEWVVRRLSGMA